LLWRDTVNQDLGHSVPQVPQDAVFVNNSKGSGGYWTQERGRNAEAKKIVK
jgi:hypothetical protein